MSLALGGAHTCAILFNCTVMCWGSNAHGQLGILTVQTYTSIPMLVNFEGVFLLGAGSSL